MQDQRSRDDALNGLKSGKLKAGPKRSQRHSFEVLVATDVAARGLDIKGVADQATRVIWIERPKFVGVFGNWSAAAGAVVV